MTLQALLAALCCITLSASFGKDVNATAVRNFKDNASVNQLISIFKDAPMAIYASAVPHGAYSFQAPAYKLPAPPPSPSPFKGPLVPVHNENVVIQKQSGYLTDSYGNRFLETPQSVAYKTTFPQEFVSLQDLPAHLSQPLTVASPGLHFNHNLPQFSYGAPFNAPALQTLSGPSPTPLFQFSSSQNAFPFTYAGKSPLISATTSNKFPEFPSFASGVQQPSNQNVIYAHTDAYGRLTNFKAEPARFQRLEQQPQAAHSNAHHETQYQDAPPPKPAPLKNKITSNLPIKHVKVAGTNNGKKTVVTVPTTAPIPHLLDISLLEPLVFENPVVPQVQHFLPRINYAPINKPLPAHKPLSVSQPHNDNQAHHVNKAHHINKAHHVNQHHLVNQPLPVNQAMKHHKEILVKNTKYYSTPTTYRPAVEQDLQLERGNGYSSSEEHDAPSGLEPKGQQKEINYDQDEVSPNTNNPSQESNDREPSYNLEANEEDSNDSSEEQPHENYRDNKSHHHPENHSEEQHSEEESDEDHTSPPKQQHQNYKQEHYHEKAPPAHPTQHSRHPEPPRQQYEQRPVIKTQPQKHYIHYENRPTRPPHHEKHHSHDDGRNRSPKHYSQPLNAPKHLQFQSVHPNWQHQHEKTLNAPIIVLPQQKPSPPVSHVEEKSKRIIIKEETPVQTHTVQEQVMEQMIDEEENNEEDFEKAYKQAAYGFPAYEQQHTHDKDIYSPASYGEPQYAEFDFENSPFSQYVQEGDEFPQSSRLTYKQMRDDHNKKYYEDYISKQPKQIKELSKMKENYFQAYKQHKPINYFSDDKHKKSKPHVVYNYKPAKKNTENEHFARYKIKPVQYEYSYSKGKPKDAHAHDTKPHKSFAKKWTSQFVEPQFQYGFEPIPKLLDSELAAMASNDNPESEKPGSRKKIYKENWYIKKTSTGGGAGS